jgi:hypothetical protein
LFVNQLLTLGHAVPGEFRQHTHRMLANVRQDVVTRSRRVGKTWSADRYTGSGVEALTLFVVMVGDSLVGCQHWRDARVNVVENATPLRLRLAGKYLGELFTQVIPVVKLRRFFRFQTKT